jgi:hypothetical protein
VVEDDLLERHGDRLGRLEADGGGALLLIVDLRQVELTHDDLLVRDAEAHALRELVLLEEFLEGVAQSGDVGDFTVADDARGELDADCALDPVRVRLDGGEEGAIQVQAHRRAVVVLAESEGHSSSGIGSGGLGL